jgi:hypothetical protein
VPGKRRKIICTEDHKGHKDSSFVFGIPKSNDDKLTTVLEKCIGLGENYEALGGGLFAQGLGLIGPNLKTEDLATE